MLAERKKKNAKGVSPATPGARVLLKRLAVTRVNPGLVLTRLRHTERHEIVCSTVLTG
jgi:hypothetical protein